MMRMFLTCITRRQQFECSKGIESMIMSDKGRVVHCTRVKAESEAHGRSRKERCSANRHHEVRDRNPVDLQQQPHRKTFTAPSVHHRSPAFCPGCSMSSTGSALASRTRCAYNGPSRHIVWYSPRSPPRSKAFGCPSAAAALLPSPPPAACSAIAISSASVPASMVRVTQLRSNHGDLTHEKMTSKR